MNLELQQFTMRSQTSTSTYSSASAGSESSEPVARRLMRHSSLETINTNITNADEFVWVDSHNRSVTKLIFNTPSRNLILGFKILILKILQQRPIKCKENYKEVKHGSLSS